MTVVTITKEDYMALEAHAEQATATLALVLKASGGSVKVPRKVLDEGFEEGEFVNLSIDPDTKDMTVFIDGQ